MSRHEIKQDDGKEISVGWDRPMRTFFAQVRNPWQDLSNEVRNQIYEATANDKSPDAYGIAIANAEDDLNENQMCLWLGGNFDEYPDIDKFISALESNGYSLTSEMIEQLKKDKADAPPVSSNIFDQFFSKN